MIEHETIEIFSSLWYKTNVVSLLVIVLVVFLCSKFQDKETQKKISFAIGTILFLRVILIHPYQIYLGNWTIESSLPFHLCGISSIISAIILFRFNQSLYEFLALLGVAGATHSFLTPEFTTGTQGFLFYDYYIAHGGIILSALYLTYVQGHKPRIGSWWSVFCASQLFIIVVSLFNVLLKSNYMYTCQKPIAENPLIFGQWPYYFLGFELIGFAHIIIFYFIFKNFYSKNILFNESIVK